MNIMMPEWLLVLLLVLGAGLLIWVVLIILTFVGLWFMHPRDAHDDINISDKKRS